MTLHIEKSKILTAERFYKLNLWRNLKKRTELDTVQTKRDRLKAKVNNSTFLCTTIRKDKI